MTVAERVNDVLLLWEEALAEGQTVTFEDLCKNCPELLPEVRRRAGELAALDAFIDPNRTCSVPSVVEADAPFSIDGYEVLHRLGRGGMGDVYAAKNLALERDQAVKIMRSGLLSGDAAEARFRREMRLLAKLDHPNIVPIFEASVQDGRPYFVMPLVNAGSLSDNLERFKNDPLGAARLIEQVARGVHHAHQTGILHRDLKPANILIGAHDRPLISDFGIATALMNESVGDEAAVFGNPDAETPQDMAGLTRITRTGQRVGTLQYMAPEQVRGDRELIGPPTDVWALGVILYRILTLQMPFGIDPPEEVVWRIQYSQQKPLADLIPNVDPRLEAIITRCLQKKPEDRYPSAAAMADDLAAVVRPPREHTVVSRSLAAGLLLFGALIAAVVLFPNTPPPRTPKESQKTSLFIEQVEPLLGKLSRGHETILVGDPRRSPIYRVAFGPGRALNPERDDHPNTLRLSSEGPSLVELLPSIPKDRFRVEAEMTFHRTREGAPEPMVGIFLGHTEYAVPNNQGTQHMAMCLLYCEVRTSKNHPLPEEGPNDFDGASFMTLWFVGESPDHPHRNAKVTPWAQPCKIPVGMKPYPQREIAFEYDRRELRAYFDGFPPKVEPFAVMKSNDIDVWELGTQQLFRRKFPELIDMPMNLPPTGGIGICVQDATVSVRRVTVIPLE